MSIPSLLQAVFNSISLLMHPPVPVIDPPPEPSGAPGISDEELAKLSEASAVETIEVVSDAPAESASSVHLDRSKLRYRPSTQPSDLLRQIPGLAVSQHAGGGKADQYFIRGFDADHGTDVAIFSDGVPVNLTSHGHGQGYADTHWMIPETIETVDMHKGPYAARYGDFYTAGALEMKTIDKVEGPTVWIASGAPMGNSTRFERYDSRLVGMASPRIRNNADDTSLIALQVAQNDGPFIAAQDFRQGNALVKWKGKIGPGRLELAGTWYSGTWNQSGQLPEGEIAAGRLDRFGSIDPSEGGIASRSSISARYSVRDAAKRSTLRVAGYGVKNDLELYSNFTLFARDAMNGDQIGQTDDRMLFGLDAAYEKGLTIGSMQALITTGVQVRSDDVETSLFQAKERTKTTMCFGETANPCNHTDNGIRNVAAYVEGDLVPVEWLHIRPGLRVDAFHWQVDDLAMNTAEGKATKAIVGPKLSIEAHESEQMTFFFNAGSGFHSNDARSAVATKGRGSLARALGTEAGVRMTPHANARVSADLWYLYLTSEQVWSGDAGGTSPSDPTRRFGIDVEGSVDATSWLSLDANLTWAKSTLVANQGNGGALALAPRWMGSGGVSIHDKHNFVSVRSRGIADRAGNEDGTLTAKGYLLFDLIAGKKVGKLDLELTVANLLNTKWREAQFAEESRVSPNAEVMEQMHFTPGMPLTATIKAAYKF
ncbi:MAG: TonB-dependent receptor plug domain-containing protein [Deltaproteobacteria bacterium]|nr:TonB-dependent receptor plug domain-containing protein [Deltaproteobacteria bacterium]